MRASIATIDKEIQKSEADSRDAQAALSQRDAALRAEAAVVLKQREAAYAELPMDYRTPDGERRRKKPALVNVIEGDCAVCHMRVPPQRLVEVQLGRVVHTCPGSSGYPLP